MIRIEIDPEDPGLMARVRPFDLHVRRYPRTPRLYRFFDDTDALLYVGITTYFPERWTAHRRTAGWWRQVSYVTVTEPFAGQWEAEVAETSAILDEAPIHNRRSSPAWYSSRRAQ